MSENTKRAAPQSTDRKPIVVGLLAAPGLLYELAQRLARELPGDLSARFTGFSWQFVVREEVLAAPEGNDQGLVEIARKRLLDEQWKLAICLTDLPLHVGRRPVTARVSVSLGVGVVSVPALGAIHLEANLRQAVISLIEALVGESVSDLEAAAMDRARYSRMQDRLEELSGSVGRVDIAGDGTLRFVSATTQGNLRLVSGMLRANRPWRVVTGLSRALVASVGTGAFALTSTGVWMIAHGMGLVQMLAAAVGSVAAICVSLIVVHGLWERSPGRENAEARKRTVLFNTTTVITVLIGVLTLYVAQLVINVAVVRLLVTPGILETAIHHAVGIGDLLWLAWLATSMAAVGGALGAALEDNSAVREAAYGYHPDHRIEAQRHEA
jgi:hypothetical protein